MARSPFKLSSDIASQVASLATDLSAHLDELRGAFDERSDKWRESDKGLAVDGWLDELGDLADALENAPIEPEE